VEAIADAVSDGLAGLELRFSPQFIAAMTGLDPDDVIEAVSDAASGARRLARTASGMPCAWPRDASATASAAPKTRGSWTISPPAA
jgi:adenosine deaminase